MVARFKLLLLGIALITFPASAPMAQPASENASLETIIDAYEALVLATDPSERARENGRGLSAWPDVSPAAQRAKQVRLEELLSGLEQLPEASKSDVNYRILQAILKSELGEMEHDTGRIPFTGDWGFHSNLLAYARRVEIKSWADAQDYLKLLNSTKDYFRAQMTNMRRGIETGYTAYVDPLDVTIEQIAEQIVDDPVESDLFAPFQRLKGLSERQRNEVTRKGKAAVADAVDAFKDVHDFLTGDYRDAAREAPGIGSVAGGAAAYATFVKVHTTRWDLTPEAVHTTGQAEVARIRAEMEAILVETEFDGSFEEFLAFLRTSPEFYAETPEDLLEKASRISKRLDAILPKYFGKLPRLPYGVEPVDPAIAPGFTTGRYSGGDLKSGTPGTYLVNTYRLDQRPLYQLPALSAHEAVPGHHLQISLAQELENVPRFRQSYYATAFGEGWGLYAEKIAGEAGIYLTPYERFGALSYEMWRACRLVADTGLHYYGWSRDEAESCFRENTALSELNIKTEVTRYIGWPGQALGYKMGEITIRELRRKAEDALGEKFDIRAFHDKVLEDGSMPLGMLEEKIEGWIASYDN